MPAPAQPTLLRSRLEPGTVLGDWRIEGVIGSGGMGTVYAAVHEVIGKRAAIKVVRSELCTSAPAAERFVEEARVVNQIGHPNIVDIFHIGALPDGRPYLVMELLRGRTLGQRLSERRVAPLEACDLLLQMCDALTAAHAHGVVHRDLKPDNVFLVDETDGAVRVKLVDWGIAKRTGDGADACGLTTTGMLIGTPQYMSPEQARGKQVDGRSDVYSLGVMAFEMFLERMPFCADNIADLVTMHLREIPPRPSDLWRDVPPELERLLLAMLSKRPADRPSLDDVVITLRSVRELLDSRSRWRGGGVTASVAAAAVLDGSPALALDRAPTWGMNQPAPAPRLLSYSSRGISRRIHTPRHAITRALAAVATFMALCGVATVVTEIVRDPEVLSPPASAADRAGVDRATTAAVVPQVGAVDPGEVPEVAPALEPGHDPGAQLAGGPAQGDGAAVATLDLRVHPANARIRVGGVVSDAEGGRLVQPIEGGVLDLAIEAPGYAPYRRSLEVGPGLILLEVRLKKATRSSKRATRDRERTRVRSESRRSSPTIDPDGTIDPFR